MADELAHAIVLLKTKLAAKQQEVEALNRAISQLEQVARVVEPGSTLVSTEFAGLTIGEAAKRWLAEIGRPATTREIAEALLANGVQTTSKNFTMTAYTIVRTLPEIEKDEHGLWRLRQVPSEQMKADGDLPKSLPAHGPQPRSKSRG